MSKSGIDYALLWVVRGLALISVAIVSLIIVFLVVESMPGFQHIGILRFFTDESWHPSLDALQGGGYNLFPMIVGSLALMIGAIIIAGPLGVLSAVFCHYYAPLNFANVYRRLIELLAGIPSVVYGFWGLVTLVPLIQCLAPPGPSLLAGIIILAIMILPTVALLTDAALANVPRSYLLGAASLGLSRWGTFQAAVVPVSKSGIYTAIILAAGRAIGETMAILMVCGNIVQIPGSLFDPIRSLTSNIALEMAYAVGDHRSSLFVSGLFLTLIVMLLVVSAQWITRGRVYGN